MSDKEGKKAKRRQTRSQSVSETATSTSTSRTGGTLQFMKSAEQKDGRVEEGRKKKNRRNRKQTPVETGTESGSSDESSKEEQSETEPEVEGEAENWEESNKEEATKMLQFLMQLAEREPTMGIIKKERAAMKEVVRKIRDIVMMYEGAIKILKGQVKEGRRERSELEVEVKSLKKENGREGEKASGNGQMTYARAVGRTYGVILEATDKRVSSEEVKKMVKEQIRPAEEGIWINKVKKVPKGLLIDCKNKKDIDHIKRVVASKLDGAVRSSDVTKNRPRMIIPRVEADMGEKEMMEVLWQHNDKIREAYADAEEMGKEIKVRTYMKNGGGGTKRVIVEVTAKMRNVLKDRRVNLGWYSQDVTDHLSILQCYRCYGFGHMAGNCKEEKVCGRCAGPHDYKDCAKEIWGCIVCVRYNRKTREGKVGTEHDVKDRECPTMRRIRRAVQESIEYEE